LGVIKTAEYLAAVDRKFDVHRQWGRGVYDPYLSVLGTIKTASCSYKGKSIKKDDLTKAAEILLTRPP